MLHDLVKPFTDVAAAAAIERLVLSVNHLLAGEPRAAQRLVSHAGRTVRVEVRDLPSLLPPPPELAFCITRAGMFEWLERPETVPAVDLTIRIDGSNPARAALAWIGGKPPAADIEGDSALAADIHWLSENLRWDLADDLERAVGPLAAREITRVGTAAAQALRRAAGMWAR